MSHVDDGTLHAYLDGELSPAEAQGVEAHVAQCPGCRARLEEDRALIARAGELLALAAPPDRELPPFRAGDAKPPTRLWWQVRLPLAWAATVALALGIGTYLGHGVEDAPVASELAQRESRAKVRGAAPAPPAAPLGTPAPATRHEADDIARRRDARVAARAEASSLAALPRDRALSAAQQVAAPPAAVGGFDDGRSVMKGSRISVDTARVLLGTDPLAVPGAPIRAMYRARELGYSAVVIVEQTLGSNTVIQVVTGRRAPLTLDQVVVSGANPARTDSVDPGEQALRGRAAAADRPTSRFFVDVRGPLSPDSLAALQRRLQPLRP